MQESTQKNEAGTETNLKDDHIIYLDKLADRLIKAISERPAGIKLHGLLTCPSKKDTQIAEVQLSLDYSKLIKATENLIEAINDFKEQLKKDISINSLVSVEKAKW